MFRFLLFALLILSFPSCQAPPCEKNKKPLVLVSLAPYAHVVKTLAPDLVEVDTLIPQGANPHVYEAPPQRVAQHQQAALWLYLGESSDKKMLRYLKKTTRAINIAQGLELLSSDQSHHHDSRDLHVWMSPRLIKIQSKIIADALIALLPESRSLVEENLLFFSKQLDQLDATLTALLAPKKGSVILVSHPAFAYFCKEYGLQQLSIETEGKEPKPHDLDRLLLSIKKNPVNTIITEPQHSNKGAEALSHLLGISTHMIDPYAEDYETMLLQLAELITR